MKFFKVLFIAFLSVSVVACGSDEKEGEGEKSEAASSAGITGDWLLSDLELQNVPEDQKAMAEQVANMMKGKMSMSFSADGKYSGETDVMGQQNSVEGTWELDGSTLKMVKEDGESETAEVLESTGSSLKIKTEMNGQSVVMIFDKQ